MSNYNVGDKFEIEIASVYDDHTSIVNVKTNEVKDCKLYRIKGFNTLVFDENGLNKLKKIKPEVAPRKTVKASELAVDTKVICWDEYEKHKCSRCFATLHNKGLYTYHDGCSSRNVSGLTLWEHMTLEDGTPVLPE